MDSGVCVCVCRGLIPFWERATLLWHFWRSFILVAIIYCDRNHTGNCHQTVLRAESVLCVVFLAVAVAVNPYPTRSPTFFIFFAVPAQLRR